MSSVITAAEQYYYGPKFDLNLYSRRVEICETADHNSLTINPEFALPETATNFAVIAEPIRLDRLYSMKCKIGHFGIYLVDIKPDQGFPEYLIYGFDPCRMLQNYNSIGIDFKPSRILKVRRAKHYALTARYSEAVKVHGSTDDFIIKSLHQLYPREIRNVPLTGDLAYPFYNFSFGFKNSVENIEMYFSVDGLFIGPISFKKLDHFNVNRFGWPFHNWHVFLSFDDGIAPIELVKKPILGINGSIFRSCIRYFPSREC